MFKTIIMRETKQVEQMEHVEQLMAENIARLEKLLPSQRERAMTWWNDLTTDEKWDLMQGEFQYRYPQHLYPKEIETIWAIHGKSNHYE